MSAWLVFAMMGFYPVCPGSGQYVITAPAFDKITIRLPDKKNFTSSAVNLSDSNYFIQSVTGNGRKVRRYYLTHDK